MENGLLINPTLIKKEGATTVQDGRSGKDKSYNKEDNKVANKDKPESFIKQCQLALLASDIFLNNYSTIPFS